MVSGETSLLRFSRSSSMSSRSLKGSASSSYISVLLDIPPEVNHLLMVVTLTLCHTSPTQVIACNTLSDLLISEVVLSLEVIVMMKRSKSFL